MFWMWTSQASARVFHISSFIKFLIYSWWPPLAWISDAIWQFTQRSQKQERTWRSGLMITNWVTWGGSTHRVLHLAAGNPVLAPGLPAQQEHCQGVAPAGQEGEGGAALAEVGRVGAGEQGEAAPASQEGVQVSSAGVRQHFIGPVVGHRDLSRITMAAIIWKRLIVLFIIIA